MKPQSKARTCRKKPQPVILTRLRDRIYAYLCGCDRGEIGLLKGVPNATLFSLARAFQMREAAIKREVDRLIAAGGASRLGDQVFPLPGYKMQPVAATLPRNTLTRGSKPKTRSIAGHALTLAEGVRYVAMRPMVPPAHKPVTVSIRELPSRIGALPAQQVTTANREEANKLLRAFNGRNSLDGRVW